MVAETSHPNLEKLQELRPTLTYKGWEIDFRDAEDAHNERDYCMDFPKTLRKLKVKQKLHDGDRSHPRLVALDSIIRNGLTFPGWQVDVQQCEKMHAEVPYFARSDIGFNSKLRSLEYSQRMYEQTGKVEEKEQQQVKEETSPRTTVSDDKAVNVSNPLGLCTICGDETKTHAFIPCGHLCTCQECASKVMRRNTRCPICRCNSIDSVQIYL